jgi:hypothetical protein
MGPKEAEEVQEEMEEVENSEELDSEIDEGISEEGEEQESVENNINEVMLRIKHDTNTGEFIVPDDVPDDIAYYASTLRENIELKKSKARDNIKIKRLKDQQDKLITEASKFVMASLSEAQKDELEDLKYSDPERWRLKVNKYEEEARQQTVKKLSEAINSDIDDSEDAVELEYRRYLLDLYNKQNPKIKLTDELLAKKVPPNIITKLSQGEITFSDFLEIIPKYLGSTSLKKEVKVGKNTKLSKIGRGSSGIKNSKRSTYKEEIY